MKRKYERKMPTLFAIYPRKLISYLCHGKLMVFVFWLLSMCHAEIGFIHKLTSLLENLGLWACKWWKALYLIALTHFKMRKHILHSTLIKFTFKYHTKNVSYEEFGSIVSIYSENVQKELNKWKEFSFLTDQFILFWISNSGITIK